MLENDLFMHLWAHDTNMILFSLLFNLKLWACSCSASELTELIFVYLFISWIIEW